VSDLFLIMWGGLPARRRGIAMSQSPENERGRHWRRRLPHYESPGATYFLVFRLVESSMCDLATEDLAPIVIDALFFFHNERYLLFDYTVMPDHVHAMLKPLQRRDGTWEPLSAIKHSLKSWTANRLNSVIGRTGRVWQDESFDHVIRGKKDFEASSNYIWLNPVAAGLVDSPTQWRWWGKGSHRCKLTDRPNSE
jgi:REP element-mobilizing transposase RayT